MLLRQHDFRDGTSVNREGLKKLRARPDRLGVLNDHPHCSGARTVGDLNPVPTDTYTESQGTRHVRCGEPLAPQGQEGGAGSTAAIGPKASPAEKS